jgi:hypothetical protein
MRRQGAPVSREALYEEVWTDAVTVVAPRYGLSDVGLVKICKKLGIPVPPRGYYAKVKAGRPTRKVPLPALPAGARGLAGRSLMRPDTLQRNSVSQETDQSGRRVPRSISIDTDLPGTPPTPTRWSPGACWRCRRRPGRSPGSR